LIRERHSQWVADLPEVKALSLEARA